ncbi:hypothetical protein LCGC14_0702960 [marine sediment metagenome]|uniref:Uncharacterized protein n=1 Tax=marine sediment metagenome TaxID=412755 RepID=A0A0F9T371_9ZZZZ
MAAMDDVISVTVNIVPNVHRYGSGGQSKRVFGTSDWNIQITQKAQGNAVPTPAAGAIGTIVVTEQTSGETYTSGASEAICASVTVNLDQDTGLPIEYVYDIQSNGTLTPAVGTAGAGVASSKTATVTWS